MGRFVGDLGAALTAALVVIGDRLGLYRAMSAGDPVTPDELAERSEERIAEAFETGRGVGWHEHHHDVFTGTERCTGRRSATPPGGHFGRVQPFSSRR